MRKVLIADDDQLSRHLLQSTLEKAGYEVIAVNDGIAAARALSQADGPRLALLDWMMPGMDGPAVIRSLRVDHDRPYIHIVLLTSRQSKEDLIAGLEAGADDYLTKPFHPPELRARLRTGERILMLEEKLVQAREDMRYKATHDALTSLWNRAVILDILQREITRSTRDQSKGVTVVIADIDHFKKINDTYGHVAGDEVLREVARRLNSSVRNYDAVARYGGEEFLLVLVGCPSRQGIPRAENLRKLIDSSPFETPAGFLNITMSLGVAGTDDWSGLSAGNLIHEADVALYRAKETGRNRSVLALPSGPQDTVVPIRKEESPIHAT